MGASTIAGWLRRGLVWLAAPTLIAAAPPPALLPPPSGDPRTVSALGDPLIAFAEAPGLDIAAASALLAGAVRRSPGTGEAIAIAREAEGARGEARAALRPRIDADLTEQHVVSRGFSYDPGNLIERSRPGQRADLSLSAEQLIWDFGAAKAHLHAARDRALGESARARAVANDTALEAAQDWCNLRAALTARAITDASVRRHGAILADTRERVRAGVGAPGDADRVEAALGGVEAEAARADGEVGRARV